ncbi:MAG TPA: tRNA (adenosine(37)-N6)-threonylcarbamoyltransferase complex ATPase subunit type 1 TsaE [Candidatus Nanopelagicaceae bacterium]|nr:tRNA (adenosine(37)-N6)-threonylcarbamoyltransferase complex ATPase subunit type 1 TsaE [Candidatus Nanopelagicaceae bacterium]
MDTSTTDATGGQPGPRRLVSRGPEETARLGWRIGSRLRPGDCLALEGGLGSGKTTLTQGIVAGAGGGHDVRSPTFLLHAVHPGRVTVHHLDLYRLPEAADLRALGLDEFLEEGAAVVEWAERASGEWFNGVIRIAVLGPSERDFQLWLPSHLEEPLQDV